MNQILVATIIAVSIIGTGAYAASQVSEMSAASSRSSDLMTPKYFQLHQLSEMSAASSMSSDIDIEKKSEMSAASSMSSDIDIEKKSESMDAYFDDVSINIINTGKDQSEIAMFRFYDNLGDKDLKEVIFPELYDDDDDDTIETTQSSTMCSGNAGCTTDSKVTSSQVSTQSNCNSSYLDVCIPPYPPDLNCGDIEYSNFRVIGNDPHGFDRDNDGIGCES